MEREQTAPSDREHEVDRSCGIVSSGSDVGANAYDGRTKFEGIATFPRSAGIWVRAVKDGDDSIGVPDLTDVLFKEHSWVEWLSAHQHWFRTPLRYEHLKRSMSESLRELLVP